MSPPTKSPLTVITVSPNILAGNHKIYVTDQSRFAPVPLCQFKAVLGEAVCQVSLCISPRFFQHTDWKDAAGQERMCPELTQEQWLLSQMCCLGIITLAGIEAFHSRCWGVLVAS